MIDLDKPSFERRSHHPPTDPAEGIRPVSSTHLKWSNKSPDQEGWYWNRTAPGHAVMQTQASDTAPVCLYIFKPTVGSRNFEILSPDGQNHVPVQTLPWQQWAGPIPYPTD